MNTARTQETIEVGADLSALIERLSPPEGGTGRLIVGIVGAPGSGKSTLAHELAARLGNAVVLPMDGFHIASPALTAAQRQRRGAIDTFDVDGYLCMLERLRRRGEAVVYAPGFERDVEEPIAGLIPIRPDVPVVITEGNYLLSAEPGWREIRALLDQAWFVEADSRLRVERLIARHIRYGKSPDEAVAMAEGSDEHNARRIAVTRAKADLVIRLV